jgi:hypothetical protein
MRPALVRPPSVPLSDRNARPSYSGRGLGHRLDRLAFRAADCIRDLHRFGSGMF